MKKNIDEKLRFVAILLCIMIVWALRLFPFKFGGWNQATLAFSYRYGFIQRAFIGSLLDAVSTVFGIPLSSMRYIHGIAVMSMFTVTVLFLAYKSQNKKNMDSVVRDFLKWMAVLFFVGPGWNSLYNNFGLTDTWLVLFAIAGVYLVLCNKDNLLAAVLLVSAAGVLVHTAYVFLYFNLVIFAFGYRMWIADGQKCRGGVLWMSATLAADSLLFLYMMFFAHVKEGVRMEDIISRIAAFMNKTVEDVSNKESLLNGYLYREGAYSGVLEIIISSWGLLLIVAIIVFSPFIYEAFRYWRDVVASSKAKTPAKSKLYMLIPFGILTTVPMYLMALDYGRWTYAVFFYEFAVIWILNVLEDKNAVAATHNFMKRLSKNKLYYIFLMFYAAVLGPIEQNLINPVVSLIEQTGWKILEWGSIL